MVQLLKIAPFISIVIMINFAGSMNKIKVFLFFSAFFVLQLLSGQNNETWNKKNEKGEKVGQWKGYHKSGKVRYIGQFEKDIPVGVFRYYFETGEVKTVLKYKNRDEAYATHYYQNGEPMAKGKFLNQKKDSTWETYGAHRTLVDRGSYLRGKKYGVWKTYYANGQVSDEVTFEADLEQGTYKKYYSNGTLKQESLYKDGFLEGLSIFYGGNGKKTSKGLYVRGYRNGHWVYYDDKQEVQYVLKYKMGTLLNPEDKITEEEDLSKYKNNRKDVLEFEDLERKITYD